MWYLCIYNRKLLHLYGFINYSFVSFMDNYVQIWLVNIDVKVIFSMSFSYIIFIITSFDHV